MPNLSKIKKFILIKLPIKSAFIKGVCFMTLYALFSSLNDMCMKFVDISIIDTIFWRNLGANIILLPFVLKQKFNITFESTINHFIRAFMFGFGMCAYIKALKKLPLSAVVAINFSIPLWVTLFAYIFLSEKIKGRMLPIIIGFIGVFIICLPNFEHSNLGATVQMILATIIFAALDVFNKYLLNTESVVMMIFGSNFFITLLCLPFISFELPTQLWALLYLAAGSNLVLYFLLKAWQSYDISALQPIKYIEFPFAIYFGSLVFKDITNFNVILGVSILFAGLLLNIYKENIERKKQ